MLDAAAASQLSALLKTLPSDVVDDVLKLGRAAPTRWRGFSVADMIRRLRGRFDLTQRQLAILAGLPHSKVVKIEAGQDVRLSTLYQLFAGFGCGLALLPVSRLDAEDLWRRFHDLCGKGLIPTIVQPQEVAVSYARWRD